ncbi:MULTISPECIES: FecCD family ABC transporter permease [Rhizobium/Agrobacterium group]|uniref:FecCD family ABC transporter permease n=1 Tax=Rhizobium/Agrobacterium group TaxID=227290 RepID=UPI000DD3FD7E|nr:iron ABC transporter permease [Rhizobium sp. SJZ105]TWC83719.1 iron complex transport system permease protein [Rhizobium sp. SJZ105]UXU05646.1 iron ABC transporter permease [Agrobacterium tumefaciens]
MSLAALSSTEGRVAGDRSRQGVATLAVLVCILLFACGVSLVSGPTGVGISELWAYLTGSADQLDARDKVILEAVRLPRTALGMLIGAGLGVSGAMMQGLFRNPLADPGIVGVTSGAALFAVAAISLGEGALATVAVFFGPHFLPLMAFFGGLLNTWLLYVIATRDGATSTTTLILAGIAVAAISGALTGLMIFVADDRALRDITFWSLGSLGGATPAKVLATLPFIVVVLAIIPFVARGLDALILGDAAAFHMGIPVQRLKRVVILAVAAACGASVAAAGSIGFVGIVVPHLLRLAIGPSHRFLLPASALGGAALLLLADSFARTVAAPAELPIGVVTALIGAPVFLFLLLGRGGFSMRNMS